MYIIFSLLKQMTIIITNRTRKYEFKLGIKCIVNVISCFFFLTRIMIKKFIKYNANVEIKMDNLFN